MLPTVAKIAKVCKSGDGRVGIIDLCRGVISLDSFSGNSADNVLAHITKRP